MSKENQTNPSIMSHVSIGTNDVTKALTFYDAVLATIGAKRMLQFPDADNPHAVAYGREYPEFWVHPPHDEGTATVGNGTHFGFFAHSQDEVDAFYKAALEQGGKGDGEPGGRPLYGEAYYGCFVRDLDGHKIEATYWDMSKMGEPT